MDPRDAKELISMPVVATTEGRRIGRVKDVLFDPSAHALLGLMVGADDVDATMFLERQRIKGIGQDAVTVEGESALEPYAPAGRTREVVESGIHLRGANVLTEGGDSIGKLDRVLVNEDGTVASYRVSKGLLGFIYRKEIPPSEIVKIGEDAVIVADTVSEVVDEGVPSHGQAADGREDGTAGPPT